jgi:uncharacterized membrane protein
MVLSHVLLQCPLVITITDSYCACVDATSLFLYSGRRQGGVLPDDVYFITIAPQSHLVLHCLSVSVSINISYGSSTHLHPNGYGSLVI